MPRGDGTGPKGQGPKTGRGLGNCKTTKTNKKNIKRKRGFGNENGQGWPRGFGGYK